MPQQTPSECRQDAIKVDPCMPKVEALACNLYSAYCTAVGGKAFNGDPLPDWITFRADPNKQKQVNAWIEVAHQVLGASHVNRMVDVMRAAPATREQSIAITHLQTARMWLEEHSFTRLEARLLNK